MSPTANNDTKRQKGGKKQWLTHLMFVTALVFFGANFASSNLNQRLRQTSRTAYNHTRTSRDTNPHLSRSLIDKAAKQHVLIPLQELTKGDVHPIECPEPLLPIYNYIPNPSNITDPPPDPRRIPRIIHMSMKSRCAPIDFVETVEHWKANFPYHEIYFHDDEAVESLFQSYGWEEFPHLHKIMQCVKWTGAMKIDVWRVLVVYKYGGLYTDIDNWPTREFNEYSPIQTDDDAFFMSDGWNRPSQWFFAMIPRHPIAYHAVYEILMRVWKMKNIEAPSVVFVTGPDALKHGYGHGLMWGKNDTESHKDVFSEGRHVGHLGKNARKTTETKKYMMDGALETIVTYNGKNTTKKERAQAQSGVPHWKKRKDKDSDGNKFKGSCREFLYLKEHAHADSSRTSRD